MDKDKIIDNHLVTQYAKVFVAFLNDTWVSGIISFTDEECKKIMDTILTELPTSPNRAREAMNYALIAIGTYKPALTASAISFGMTIGPVEIDHGRTSCKTPFAPDYIKKARAHIDKKKR